MATIGAAISTVSNILKDMYLPPVVEQLNNEVLFSQLLETSSKELFGNQAVVPLHTGRSGGIGARDEDEDLPDAGFQPYAKAVYDLKFLYGRVRVTGPSMAKTRSEVGAFLEVLKGELDGLRADLKKDLARQFYGSGDGKLATCGVSVATNDVLLGSDEALRKGQIYKGIRVTIGTAANVDSVTGGSEAYREVTAVNVGTKTITIDGAVVTTAATDFVFRHKSVKDGGVKEIMGISGIVPTAANSLGGINAATAGNEYWDNLRDTTGGALAQDNMIKAWNQVKIAGGDVSHMITSYGIQRAYFNLLQSQVRYSEPTRLKGGFEALDFMQKPLIADLDAPFGKIFFIDTKWLKIFTNRDWHFLDKDGDVLKWVQNRDAWQAVLARYLNMGATRRNTLMVMSGLTDSTGF
jgi:hypothetical protein